MKKVIAFGASTSSKSINKQLATFAASLIENAETEVLDLNDFLAPLYSEDEEAKGFSENVKSFKSKLDSADAFIISVAEHNGNFTSAFLNLYDWTSRLDRNIFGDKPVLLMSTSPGGRAASSAFGIAKAGFPHMGAQIVAEYSLGTFYDNFSDGKISNEEESNKLLVEVKKLQSKL
ncbi:hypothetical protein UJ101_00077 [Flavobacteriaceae bacterium UJ101]|nr:hypothetical protein UJ101_00077 [Flavobacteriaceae bacterium UJ101]